MNQKQQDHHSLSKFEDVMNYFSIAITISSLLYILLMSLILKRKNYEINKFIFISLLSLITGSLCYLFVDMIRKKLSNTNKDFYKRFIYVTLYIISRNSYFIMTYIAYLYFSFGMSVSAKLRM